MADTLPKPGTGRDLLFSYLEKLREEARGRGEEPLLDSEYAELLGVEPSSFCAWKKRKTRPAGHLWELIEEWSGGVVPARSWDTPKERRAWKRIREQLLAGKGRGPSPQPAPPP